MIVPEKIADGKTEYVGRRWTGTYTRVYRLAPIVQEIIQEVFKGLKNKRNEAYPEDLYYTLFSKKRKFEHGTIRIQKLLQLDPKYETRVFKIWSKFIDVLSVAHKSAASDPKKDEYINRLKLFNDRRKVIDVIRPYDGNSRFNLEAYVPSVDGETPSISIIQEAIDEVTKDDVNQSIEESPHFSSEAEQFILDMIQSESTLEFGKSNSSFEVFKTLVGKFFNNIPESIAKIADSGDISKSELALLSKHVLRVLKVPSKQPGHPKKKVKKKEEVKKNNFQAQVGYHKRDIDPVKDFCRDLSEDIDGLRDVIGREIEMENLVNGLSSMGKKNVMILGKAGVGKTAIVEALQLRLSKGQISSGFLSKGKRILSLDIARLMKNTQLRGDFEKNFSALLDYVEENSQEVILFADEAHLLMGAGKSMGTSIDAANLLKPAIARGTFQFIGATTSDEYFELVATDKALERRFNNIVLSEPTADLVNTIVTEALPFFAKHYDLKFQEGLVEKAVEYSSLFKSNTRYEPDKTRTFVEETCSLFVNLEEIIRKRVRRVFKSHIQLVGRRFLRAVQKVQGSLINYNRSKRELEKATELFKKECHDLEQYVDKETYKSLKHKSTTISLVLTTYLMSAHSKQERHTKACRALEQFSSEDSLHKYLTKWIDRGMSYVQISEDTKDRSDTLVEVPSRKLIELSPKDSKKLGNLIDLQLESEKYIGELFSNINVDESLYEQLENRLLEIFKPSEITQLYSHTSTFISAQFDLEDQIEIVQKGFNDLFGLVLNKQNDGSSTSKIATLVESSQQLYSEVKGFLNQVYDKLLQDLDEKKYSDLINVIVELKTGYSRNKWDRFKGSYERFQGEFDDQAIQEYLSFQSLYRLINYTQEITNKLDCVNFATPFTGYNGDLAELERAVLFTFLARTESTTGNLKSMLTNESNLFNMVRVVKYSKNSLGDAWVKGIFDLYEKFYLKDSNEKLDPKAFKDFKETPLGREAFILYNQWLVDRETIRNAARDNNNKRLSQLQKFLIDSFKLVFVAKDGENYSKVQKNISGVLDQFYQIDSKKVSKAHGKGLVVKVEGEINKLPDEFRPNEQLIKELKKLPEIFNVNSSGMSEKFKEVFSTIKEQFLHGTFKERMKWVLARFGSYVVGDGKRVMRDKDIQKQLLKDFSGVGKVFKNIIFSEIPSLIGGSMSDAGVGGLLELFEKPFSTLLSEGKELATDTARYRLIRRECGNVCSLFFKQFSEDDTELKFLFSFIPELFGSYNKDLIYDYLPCGSGKTVENHHLGLQIYRETGMKVNSITQGRAELLNLMKRNIPRIVRGQHVGIKTIVRSIQRASIGLSAPNKPLGVFFMVGPTGVGKTYTAESVHKFLSGDKRELVRLDMTEYSSKEGVYKLIGNSLSGKGGVLIDAIKKNPSVVILLDEFEKADPDVINLFLQVFDSARLSDSAGNTVRFNNAYFFLTSNYKVEEFEKYYDKLKLGIEMPPDESIKKIKDVIEKRDLFNHKTILDLIENRTEYEGLMKREIVDFVPLMIERSYHAMEQLANRLQNVEPDPGDLAKFVMMVSGKTPQTIDEARKLLSASKEIFLFRVKNFFSGYPRNPRPYMGFGEKGGELQGFLNRLQLTLKNNVTFQKYLVFGLDHYRAELLYNSSHPESKNYPYNQSGLSTLVIEILDNPRDFLGTIDQQAEKRILDFINTHLHLNLSRDSKGETPKSRVQDIKKDMLKISHELKRFLVSLRRAQLTDEDSKLMREILNSGSKKTLIKENKFRKEFVNRLTDVIPYFPITQSTAKQLIVLELKKLNALRGVSGLVLDFEEGVVDFLYNKVENQLDDGARPIIRIIDSQVKSVISDGIIEGTIPRNVLLYKVVGKEEIGIVDKDKLQQLEKNVNEKIINCSLHPSVIQDFSDEEVLLRLIRKKKAELYSGNNLGCWLDFCSPSNKSSYSPKRSVLITSKEGEIVFSSHYEPAATTLDNGA